MQPVAVGKVILVVDDDLDTAQLFAVLLRQLGHRADFVTDPREVFNVVQRMQPQLIFIDKALVRPNIIGAAGRQVSMRMFASPSICACSTA